MTGYELSRAWFDFCYDNTSKITPTHTALFFFIVEHNNRLGQKKEFGLPRQMAMDAIGIKNNRTFTKVFEDLIDWKFIVILERSKNQYSANIIALSKNTPATTKALDNAMLMHVQKQSTSNLTGIAPIDKHNNIRTEEHKTDDDVYINIATHFKRYMDNENLIKAVIDNNGFKSKSELEAKLQKFNKHLASLDQFSKTWKDYTSHFLNWNRAQKVNTKSPTDITL